MRVCSVAKTCLAHSKPWATYPALQKEQKQTKALSANKQRSQHQRTSNHNTVPQADLGGTVPWQKGLLNSRPLCYQQQLHEGTKCHQAEAAHMLYSFHSKHCLLQIEKTKKRNSRTAAVTKSGQMGWPRRGGRQCF